MTKQVALFFWEFHVVVISSLKTKGSSIFIGQLNLHLKIKCLQDFTCYIFIFMDAVNILLDQLIMNVANVIVANRIQP